MPSVSVWLLVTCTLDFATVFLLHLRYHDFDASQTFTVEE